MLNAISQTQKALKTLVFSCIWNLKQTYRSREQNGVSRDWIGWGTLTEEHKAAVI
jgi:hypothetical protein